MSAIHPLFQAILDRALQGPQPPAMMPTPLHDLTPEEGRALADLAARPEGWHGWHSRGVTRTLDQALDAVARKEDMR